MHVHSIPMWTGKGNNYAYLVTDEPTKHSVIIDPANPPEVAPVLNSQIKNGTINLTAIVNTHQYVTFIPRLFKADFLVTGIMPAGIMKFSNNLVNSLLSEERIVPQ